MTKRMLIDGTHAEETRVVVLDGNRLEDFDVETSTKKQLKGNIYLAKIVRVEPSLQAAFVEYGASRHGFLAFGEIHPDYYQIPVADRQRLIAQQEQEAREAEEAEDAAARADEVSGVAAADGHADADAGPALEGDSGTITEAGSADSPVPPEFEGQDVPAEPALAEWPVEAIAPADDIPAQAAAIPRDEVFGAEEAGNDDTSPEAALAEMGLTVEADGRVTGDAQAMAQLQEALDAPAVPDEPEAAVEGAAFEAPVDGGPANGEGQDAANGGDFDSLPPAPPPETLGGESEPSEERERRTPQPRYLRNYKIQEVIRRRQILLVQVVKEERGGKGAALTTYISLAGRFCVLMPNSPRGGGISRKITSTADRRRLKEITAELEIPSGMGLIVRTAGAARPKPEIRRDCEYLLQLWDDIRDTTMKSVAPALIYEEASLIKRVIRDVYSRDVDEVLVDGEAAWHAARDQMRLLMPSHAHKVQLWQDPNGAPLFAHEQVDIQLDAMLSPNVQLRSGGYLVINQTEALVAIDVNSGRSTRERGIEETAVRTNMEAAEEVARQLRLRDLAGLIVIDFIDMEQRRHNAMVEKKLKDALKNDRARIQLGSISHFGLMEMSRQRLRPSLAETSFVQCPHCSGTGLVRSTEGASIQVLRTIEEEGSKRRSAEIMVHVAGPVAMYILNHKRERLREIEARSGMTVLFTPDPTLLPPAVRIERLRTLAPGEGPPPALIAARPALPVTVMEDDSVQIVEDDDEADRPEVAVAPVASAPAETPRPSDAPRPVETAEGSRRRRRRRRRGGRRDDSGRPAGVDGDISAVALPGAEQPEIEDGEPDDGAPVAGSGTADPKPLPTAESESADEFAPGMTTGPGSDSGAFESSGRRRGRRGGRRRFKEEGGEPSAPEAFPAPMGYVGPTPADPFGGGLPFDIFDAIEQAEARAEAIPLPLTRAEPAPLPPAPLPPAPLPPVLSPEAPVVSEAPAAEALPAEPEPVSEPALPEPVAGGEAPANPEVVSDPAPAEPEAVAAPAVAAVKAPRVRKSRAAPKPAVALVAPEEPAPEAVPAPPGADAANGEAAAALTIAPANDPAPPTEPLIKPVLVDDAPPAPKRGWWRR
jgi:ribonuclease E